MIVLKFGGSSVGTSENIRRVAGILKSQKTAFAVVVSALSGTTDQLQNIASAAVKSGHKPQIQRLKTHHQNVIAELFTLKNAKPVLSYVDTEFEKLATICSGISALNELSDKTLARVLSFGERLSCRIVYAFLLQEGVMIELLAGDELIRANGNPLEAVVDFEVTDTQIRGSIKKKKNYICGGFIAKNKKGEDVVLGRGGSDLSASIFARALNAKRLEIWSDVNGMLNANPKVVKQASPIKSLSYQEAFELAYFGAKVLYPPTIRPVMEKNIPIYLKNTLQPEDAGTFISGVNEDQTDRITGVTSLQGISIVTISGVGLAGKKGSARRVFQALEEAEVNIILVMQGCSEQSICLGIRSIDAPKAAKALTRHFDFEIDRKLINPIEVENERSIIAVVGDRMKSQVGLGGKVFSALGENGINVTAITQGSSERNISIVVNRKDEDKAINVIHERFFQKAIKKVHVFVAGIGNVGQEFLKIVRAQQEDLIQNHQLQLIVVGIANSRQILINENGLSWNEASKIKERGVKADIDAFTDQIVELNMRNTVFIDNTASDLVSEQYTKLFKNSVSVVTCNKIAGSSSIDNYSRVLKLVKEKNCHFQYETSVGAALPIIKTIQDLRLSGDRISRIQAVLSGSLNFIFNNYKAETSFAEIVAEAKKLGLTEPDPTIDLNGLDVRRKILILAREAGYFKEMDDVKFDSFMPVGCLESRSTEAFLKSLASNEDHFSKLYTEAFKAGKRLKVIAEFKQGNMVVGLEAVGPESPFFHIGGKDNIVAIYTDRYKDQPMIIKGAGAGAEVTASGVFSDLIYIVNR